MNRSTAIRFAALCLLALVRAVFAQDPVLFQIDIERDGDDSTSFDGTLIVNTVENSAIRTIRTTDAKGALKDAIHCEHERQEFTIDRRDLFGNGKDIAKLDIFVLSNRYMPQKLPITIRSEKTELRVNTWVQAKAFYREKADGNRLPPASKEIRRVASFLDPTIHSRILEQLENEAKIEEELENLKLAALQRPLSLLLPAYIYPPDTGSLADKTNQLAQLNARDWETIEKDLSKLVRLGIECSVIINPPIGPREVVNRQYEAKIAMLRRIKAVPIGYVRLGAGSGLGRVYDTMESVQQQISDWRRIYPQIDGFFFDTCPTDEASFAGINNIASSVKRQLPRAKIVLNPGTIPHNAYLTSKSIDVVCVFESNLGAATFPQAPTTNSILAAVLWNSRQNPEDEIALLRNKGFTCFFITDRNDDIDIDGILGPDANLQWGRLPSARVWNKFLSTLAKSKIIKK